MATSKKNVSGSARATIDHDEIREWVETHGGHPAQVKRTGRGKSPGILRIDFPGFSGEGSLEPIEWDEFFQRFEESQLAFLYQDKTSAGRPSNFNKLVKRDSVELTGAQARKKTSKKARSSRAAGATRSARASASGGSARGRAAGASKRTAKRASASGSSAENGRRASKARKKTSSSARGGTRKKAASSSSARSTSAKTPRRGRAGARSAGKSGTAKTARAPSQREAPKRVAKKGSRGTGRSAKKGSKKR